MAYPTKKRSGLFERISKWWNGEWYKIDPEDNFFYVGRVYSPSAIFIRKVVEYIKKEHKFLIGTIIAILGLFLGSSLK